MGDWTAVVCRILKFSSMLSLQLCCRSLANGNISALKQSGTDFSPTRDQASPWQRNSFSSITFLFFIFSPSVFHHCPNPILVPSFPDLYDEICMQSGLKIKISL